MSKARKRSNKRPKTVTLWVYKVGFGDCLLLELGYATETRFVLIDFGTKSGLEGQISKAKGTKRLTVRIAEDITRRIAEANNGRLVGVVVTHRHSDHLSGFMPNRQGTGPGDLIVALHPQVVVQPWTELPSARANWRGPGPKGKRSLDDSTDALGLTPGTLTLVEQFTRDAVEEAEAAGSRFTRTAINGIVSAIKGDVSNRPALDLLRDLCPKAKHDFVCAGMKPKNLARVLPGVDLKVLGPPSHRQWDRIVRAFAKKAPDQYWIARHSLSDQRAFWQAAATQQAFATRAARSRAPTLFARDRRAEPPPEVRWLVERMRRDRGESLLEFVRSADRVINNTSVILLLKIGNKRLLLAGDAQLESWQYALEQADNAAATRREVAKTDLYKVGHHGSRNATPRALLWEIFAKRGGPRTPNRLTTVLSTATGPFKGKPGSEGEVPRKTLVKALKAESKCVSTLDHKGGKELCIGVEIEVS